MRIASVCLILMLMLMTGCQFEPVSTKENNLNPQNNPEINILINTINDYYNLEKAEMWDRTYEYRTPSFKKTVLKDSYIENMKNNNEGWQFIEFRIIDIELNNDMCTAKVGFLEKGPQPWGEQKVIESTKWIKYNNKWYALEPGDRAHMFLNIQIVNEYIQ